MKKISKIAVVLIMALTVLVIYSCQKDELVQEVPLTEGLQKTEKGSTGDNCNDTRELCRQCRPLYDEPQFPWEIYGFHINVGGVVYELSPTDYFSDALDFRVSSSKGDFILTNTTTKYVQDRSVGGYPKEFAALYRLDVRKLMSGGYTKTEIERDLGVSVQETTKGVFEIDAANLSTKPNTDDTAALVYLPEPCGDAFVISLMEDYYEMLGSPYEVAEINSWMNVVDFYFDQQAESIDFKTDCLSSKVLVDAILTDFDDGVGIDWSEQQIMNLKINYIGTLLDIDKQDLQQLFSFDAATNQALVDMLWNTINSDGFCEAEQEAESLTNSIINDGFSDACDSGISSDEMVADVASSLGSDADLADFYEELGGSFDFIIETESFTSNEKIKCIWDLVVQSNGSLFCSTIDNFAADPEYDLFLFVGNSPGRCAITRNNYPPGQISITFDVACIEDRTVIELIKTILHEGIHAELYRIIKSIGGYDNLSPDNYPAIWEAYRTYKDWSHEFMVEWYLEKLANSLAEIDGYSFSMEHYIALAWQGLGHDPNDPEHPITTQWDELETSEQQTILRLQQELIEMSNLDCP